MPELRPFAGLRPAPVVVGPLGNFVCPPYDVITEEQRLELLARSPYNFVRVELPAGHYGEAARLLSEWKSTGALRRDPAPALYGYRMSYTAPDGRVRQTLGVIGALGLEGPGQGILPHEQTTPKAKTDRLELLRATHANTSPIWCLCVEPGLASALTPASAGAEGHVGEGVGDGAGADSGEGSGKDSGEATGADVGAEPGARPGATRAAPPTSEVTDDDGNKHELWCITDPAVHRAVAGVVGAGPLLVADGHHRYET
ncbi:MAG: DUF1015 family protein, partial [Acidimicrobiales bacterium]